jgi:hypothetical protein
MMNRRIFNGIRQSDVVMFREQRQEFGIQDCA